jgi:hypothetical protein
VEDEQQVTVFRQLSIEKVQACECLQGFPKVGASGLLGSVLSHVLPCFLNRWHCLSGRCASLSAGQHNLTSTIHNLVSGDRGDAHVAPLGLFADHSQAWIVATVKGGLVASWHLVPYWDPALDANRMKHPVS